MAFRSFLCALLALLALLSPTPGLAKPQVDSMEERMSGVSRLEARNARPVKMMFQGRYFVDLNGDSKMNKGEKPFVRRRMEIGRWWRKANKFMVRGEAVTNSRGIFKISFKGYPRGQFSVRDPKTKKVVAVFIWPRGETFFARPVPWGPRKQKPTNNGGDDGAEDDVDETTTTATRTASLTSSTVTITSTSRTTLTSTTTVPPLFYWTCIVLVPSHPMQVCNSGGDTKDLTAAGMAACVDACYLDGWDFSTNKSVSFDPTGSVCRCGPANCAKSMGASISAQTQELFVSEDVHPSCKLYPSNISPQAVPSL